MSKQRFEMGWQASEPLRAMSLDDSGATLVGEPPDLREGAEVGCDGLQEGEGAAPSELRPDEEYQDLIAGLVPGCLVRLIVPSRDAHGRLVDAERLWAAAVGWFTAVGGGTTSIPGWGTWGKDARTVAVERVYVVESFLPDRFEVGQRLAIVGWLVEFAKRARQHALAVSIDGRLFLIENPEATCEGGVS